MTIDEIIQIVNSNIDKKLTPLQETILRQTWEGKTYVHIASELHYKQEYIRRIASNLWSNLSNIWGIELSKNNFRYKLEKKQLTEIEQRLLKKLNTQILIKYLSYPDHPLSVDSPLYVERPTLAQNAHEEITKPGGLIRIKGAQKYGKSSFILRLLHQAQTHNYHTVIVDFREAETSVFTDINKLLPWLFININLKLGIEPKPDDYWSKNLATKVNCSLSMEIDILEKINYPLVLVLNEVNLIFDYPNLAEDFFSLLRYWYEQGKSTNNWQKLRLVLAYSTDIYHPLNPNNSPFNTGLFINLNTLDLQQVKQLAKIYGFQTIAESQLEQLISFLGGNPYLIQITFYNLFQLNENNPRITLQNILNNVINNDSIYQHYLETITNFFRENTDIKNTFIKIIQQNTNINNIDLKKISKLESLGLIIRQCEQIIPSCQLYIEYFKKELITPNPVPIINNPNYSKELLSLEEIDNLTKLFNKNYFDRYLDNCWHNLIIEQKPLSILMCDLDFFKVYNDTYGSQAGDECFKKIAHLVKRCIRRSSDVVARYDGEELAIILPYADIYFAFQIAAKIRDRVRELEIIQSYHIITVSPILTVSIGLACIIPSCDYSCQQLLEASNIALKEAKQNGKNQVVISSVFNYGLIE